MFDPSVRLGCKLAGVHWWFKSRTHAAELTAGYYNTRDRDGYLPVISVLKTHGASVSFTCVEMRDCEHPYEGRCSPEGLLHQVCTTAARLGVPVAGENALQRYDQYALDKIAESAFGQTVMAGRLEVRAWAGDGGGGVWRPQRASPAGQLPRAARCVGAHPAPPSPPPSPQKLTFLRMGDMMIDNWDAFSSFLKRLTCPV